MISHEHQCIFVHVPRCGGTSIEKAIWGQHQTEEHLRHGFISRYENKYQTGGLQHLLAWQIRAETGEPVFNDYFKFTVVRNPWDKLVSQYHFMAKREDLRQFIGMNADDDFTAYLELIQKKLHVQWEHQHKFIFDENGKSMVDFVGRYEQYDRVAAWLLNRFGIRRGKLTHRNKSQRRPHHEYYNDDSRERVAQMYAKDIELFQYTFDGYGPAPCVQDDLPRTGIGRYLARFTSRARG